MKIKEGYVLSQVSGTYVVFPTGKAALDLNGMITLNDTGAFIWKLLEQDSTREEILSAVLATYDVEEARAAACVDEFLTKLKEVGCLA